MRKWWLTFSFCTCGTLPRPTLQPPSSWLFKVVIYVKTLSCIVIIQGWEWLQPVLFPSQASPAHLLEEDDDAGDQLRPSLLQLKESGRRPEQKSLSSAHFFLFQWRLPDKDLRLAEGDIFKELPVLKQHPAHHCHLLNGEKSYGDDDDVNDDNDLVPSSASPPWKFGQVNWEIILYLRCGYYGNNFGCYGNDVTSKATFWPFCDYRGNFFYHNCYDW